MLIKLVRSNTSKGAYGEDILEEALVFTTAHLESKITHVRYSLATQISQALERPLLKCLERLGARNYMSIYQGEASHNETLLKLAKLDFNLVQSLHKKELIDFERKLPFGRDCGIVLLDNGRKILTKSLPWEHKEMHTHAHSQLNMECYMKQHGVSEQETLDDVFNEQVVEGYKRGAPYKTN
ncbi:unnamed protein product [Prunus brigantina]